MCYNPCPKPLTQQISQYSGCHGFVVFPITSYSITNYCPPFVGYIPNNHIDNN